MDFDLNAVCDRVNETLTMVLEYVANEALYPSLETDARAEFLASIRG